MMNSQEKKLDAIKKAYSIMRIDRAITPEGIAHYVSLLAEESSDVVEKAVERIEKTRDYFPTVHEVLKECAAIKEELLREQIDRQTEELNRRAAAGEFDYRPPGGVKDR